MKNLTFRYHVMFLIGSQVGALSKYVLCNNHGTCNTVRHKINWCSFGSLLADKVVANYVFVLLFSLSFLFVVSL